MARLLLSFFLILAIFGADPNLSRTLKAVEDRYNRAKTLQVVFEETYTVNGKPRKAESGYKASAGKLFLSNGKEVYLYTPPITAPKR